MKNTSDLSITYSLIVNESHIDELEHVNNVVYVGWIQEAAVMHWSDSVCDTKDVYFTSSLLMIL